MTSGTDPLRAADAPTVAASAASAASPPTSSATSPSASSLPVFLSTEHWSLLGTRSLTWSEVMSRIQIHLTVVSAFLVVLALTAQAMGFGTPFRVLAIGLASAALVMGVLTAVRVTNASREDADLIRAMNRIRHAYVVLAPELEPYLTASTHDDAAGLMRTNALGRPRNQALHVVGSTGFFLMVVNALVAGTLVALVTDTAGAGSAVTAVAGSLAALAYCAAHIGVGRRTFTTHHDIRFPSDA
jgi:ABC-type transport system involved in cytochrome bd biosynthesis fused ATPase/permease subunit